MCYTYHEFTTVNDTTTIQFAMSTDSDGTGLETITMEEYPNQMQGGVLVQNHALMCKLVVFVAPSTCTIDMSMYLDYTFIHRSEMALQVQFSFGRVQTENTTGFLRVCTFLAATDTQFYSYTVPLYLFMRI